MIRSVLKMGDPLLLQVAQPVQRFDSLELAALLEDMHQTMGSLNGAGLAAPGPVMRPLLELSRSSLERLATERGLDVLDDLHVADQRGHDRLVDALGARLFHHLGQKLGEHHGRGDDRVPIAEDERVDAFFLEPELDRLAVSGGRLAAG